MKDYFIINNRCIIFSDADPKEIKQLLQTSAHSHMSWDELEDVLRSYLGDNFKMEPWDLERAIDLDRLGSTPDASWIQNHKRR